MQPLTYQLGLTRQTLALLAQDGTGQGEAYQLGVTKQTLALLAQDGTGQGEACNMKQSCEDAETYAQEKLTYHLPCLL